MADHPMMYPALTERPLVTRTHAGLIVGDPGSAWGPVSPPPPAILPDLDSPDRQEIPVIGCPYCPASLGVPCACLVGGA